MNQYFNHYTAPNEQTLADGLVRESIQIMGIEVFYIPRTQDNVDYLFNEDPSKYYNTFKTIPAYPEFINDFDGDDSIMTMFGREFQQSGLIVISRSEFASIFGTVDTPDPVPQNGDLIYFPIVDAILEIIYVENDSVFYQNGKNYIYSLRVQKFTYSHEDITTGIDQLDQAVKDDLATDDTLGLDVDVFGKNNELQQENNSSVEFDPNNPFGVRS